MVCLHPVSVVDGQSDFPCGKCLACKVSRSNEWAVRMTHESLYWSECLFTTFTYNDDNLPIGGHVSPSDFTDLVKRLNARLKYQGRPFKYFGSSEYGEANGRPHIHLITFGLSWADFEPIKALSKIKYRIPQWDKGFIDVKPLTYHRARYTAKYIQKENFERRKTEIQKILLSGEKHPPFKRASQGIGLRWAKAHATELSRGYLLFNGRKRSVPRYYVKKLDLDLDRSYLDALLAENEAKAEQEYQDARRVLFKNELDEMEWTDDYPYMRRRQEEANILSKIELKRLSSLHYLPTCDSTFITTR